MEEPDNLTIDEHIARIDAMIKEMKKMHDTLFEMFGISPHQLHHYLNDPERCPPADKAEVDRICDELERALQERIDAENQQAKNARHPSPMDLKKGSHWIYLH
jgi:hypothetical protein